VNLWIEPKPLADILGKTPEDVVMEYLMGYVDKLSPGECAPIWQKELEPHIMELRRAIAERKFDVAEEILTRIGEIQIQIRVPPI